MTVIFLKAILNLCVPMVFECYSQTWSFETMKNCKPLYKQCIEYHKNKIQ